MTKSSRPLPDRVLLAELDSVAQQKRFSALGAEEATAQLTGMLRVGRLLSGTVLVTDAMLLDGNYFISLGPEGVLRELGAGDGRFPLIVTGVARTLREGLDYRLSLPSFEWSLLAMRGTSEIPDSVRSSWDAWLALAERGFIRYEQQSRGFALPEIVSLPSGVNHSAELLESLRMVTTRSGAWQLIRDAELQQDERGRLANWWNGRYLRAVAEQASADWLSFDADNAQQLSDPQTSRPLKLPAQLLKWSRESTPASVALAWDATAGRRAKLRSRASWAAMRDLAYQATQVTASSSRASVLRDSILKVAVAALAIALAIPGVEAASLDNPLTWVLFAGVILTTVPVESLLSLRDLLRPDPHAELVLHSSGARA